MLPTASHSIRRQIIEVDLDGSEADALALHRVLAALNSRRLAPALAAALDRCAPGPDWICIDRLEIDAGRVAWDRLEQDLPMALQAALETVLETALMTQPAAAPLATTHARSRWRRSSAARALDEALACFLQYGSLPSSCQLAPGMSFEQTLLAGWQAGEPAGASGEAGCAGALLRAMNGAGARERLSTQFSPRFLHALLSRMTRSGEPAIGVVPAAFAHAGLSADAAKRLESEHWQAVFASAASGMPGALPQLASIAAAPPTPADAPVFRAAPGDERALAPLRDAHAAPTVTSGASKLIVPTPENAAQTAAMRAPAGGQMPSRPVAGGGPATPVNEPAGARPPVDERAGGPAPVAASVAGGALPAGARTDGAAARRAAAVDGQLDTPTAPAGRPATEGAPASAARAGVALVIEAWPARAQDGAATTSARQVGVPHPDAEHGIFINNAGLVLLHPFLSRLFEALALSAADRLLLPDRALRLLHYLASGSATAPEYELMLPKVLCNVALTQAVAPEIELSAAESQEAQAMLEAVIGHWSALRDTGPDGLRAAFLLRPGKLSRRGGDWLLQVAPDTADILLNELPWGISPVKLGWMEQIMWVEWT
jgi:hypothetical protein